jgi:hypothetical protein
MDSSCSHGCDAKETLFHPSGSEQRGLRRSRYSVPDKQISSDVAVRKYPSLMGTLSGHSFSVKVPPCLIRNYIAFSGPWHETWRKWLLSGLVVSAVPPHTSYPWGLNASVMIYVYLTIPRIVSELWLLVSWHLGVCRAGSVAPPPVPHCRVAPTGCIILRPLLYTFN